MHLAGETYATNLISIHFSSSQYFAHRYRCCAPPVTWFLFGPPRLRGCEGRVFGSGRGNDAPFLVDYHCARAPGADIDAQKFHPILLPFGSNIKTVVTRMMDEVSTWFALATL